MDYVGRGRSRRAPALYPSTWCPLLSMGRLRVCAAAYRGQIIDCRPNALYDIRKGIIMRGPPGDRFAVFRQHLESAEWSAFPIRGTQDDRNDAGLVGLVPGDGLGHFDAIAEVRGHKISTDEQENDLVSLEVIHDLWLPFGSRHDIAVIPGRDELLPLQVAEMLVQLFTERLILVSVRDEDFECHDLLLLNMMKRLY